jgi:hypothetical protein
MQTERSEFSQCLGEQVFPCSGRTYKKDVRFLKLDILPDFLHLDAL